MHAKSGLRVVLKWEIFRPDSVIAAVIRLVLVSTGFWMRLLIFVLFFAGLVVLLFVATIHGAALGGVARAMWNGADQLAIERLCGYYFSDRYFIAAIVFLVVYFSCVSVLSFMADKASATKLLPVRRPFVFAMVTYLTATIAWCVALTTSG